MTLLDYRRTVREAIYLWILLSWHAPTDVNVEWWPVADGNAYQDEALSVALAVPADTATRWRVRLEKAGLLRSTIVQPRYRKFELRNLNFNTEAKPAPLPRTQIN